MFRYILLLTLIVAAESVASNTPIFVVMGGYQTCPLTSEVAKIQAHSILVLAGQAKAIGDRLEANGSPKAKYFLSCYSGLLKEGFPRRIDFRYASEDLQFTSAESISLYTPSYSGPEPLSPAFAKLRELVSNTSNPVVYFFGHSYGGWTAMNAAAALALSGKIGGLVTDDAISPVECKPDKLIFKSITSGLAPLPQCTRSPADIPARVLDLIASSTPWWIHYYQTQFRFLHSSPIEEILKMSPSTGFNVRLQLPNTNPYFNDYHTAISVEPRIWKNVGEWITKSFSNQ